MQGVSKRCIRPVSTPTRVASLTHVGRRAGCLLAALDDATLLTVAQHQIHVLVERHECAHQHAPGAVGEEVAVWTRRTTLRQPHPPTLTSPRW